jgi:hypothetical protein
MCRCGVRQTTALDAEKLQSSAATTNARAPNRRSVLRLERFKNSKADSMREFEYMPSRSRVTHSDARHDINNTFEWF